jgi:ABC-type multidrug transport system fused ATPase/permease subunit
MYEIRQEQRKRMREHKFFYHFILAIGIFVYSQGCQLMQESPGYAASAVILAIIMHNASVEKVFKSIFKFVPHKVAKSTMITALFFTAFFSYFKRLGFTLFVIQDLLSIVLFVATALIYKKLKNRQE